MEPFILTILELLIVMFFCLALRAYILPRNQSKQITDESTLVFLLGYLVTHLVLLSIR